MRLHVGIDAWNLVGDRRGIGRYVREIVRRWAHRPAGDLAISLLVPEWPAWIVRKRYRRELDGLELDVRHRRKAAISDVVWYPWNGMSWISSTPSVATLHDASLFTIPPQDPAIREKEQRPFRVAAARARRIITVSNFSKTEIVRHLGIEPNLVDVIYPGVAERFAPQPEAGGQDRLRTVLFVGELEPRKGLAALVTAMELLPERLRNRTELVVAGSSGRYPMPDLSGSVRVRNLGWVDDAELARLYAAADVFAYPSEYEGFGLPIVEAMACGTPVVAADTPSHREAGAGAALYVLPSDSAALSSAILTVLTRPDVWRDLRNRGSARAKELSWDATADQTLQSLERALAC